MAPRLMANVCVGHSTSKKEPEFVKSMYVYMIWASGHNLQTPSPLDTITEIAEKGFDTVQLRLWKTMQQWHDLTIY
jgi:hypothetical protein